MKAGIRYWLQIFLIPLYLISFLVPRSKRIWVMGSTFGKRFADNPRYFYLYINQEQKQIKAVWISKNKSLIEWMNCNMPDYPAYYLYSLKGVYYALRASIYYYDNYSKDISFVLSGGAKKINLWHGIPLKKIQMDNRFDLVRHPATKREKAKWMLRRMSDEKPSHYIVTPSKQLDGIFSSAFATKKTIASGYPRNDIAFLERQSVFLPSEEKSINWMKGRKQEGEKVILYMPTFRDSEIRFFDVMDMDAFTRFLEEENYCFCVKLHPKSKLEEKFRELTSKSVYIVEQEADPYAFLSEADVLITDYSSIYFDYLLYDRPILFFSYDLEEYLKNSREFYFSYEEYTPGKQASSMQELKEALLSCNDDTAEMRMREKRRKIKNAVFSEELSTCKCLYDSI